MPLDNAFQGTLFTSDFLTEKIATGPDWKGLAEGDVSAFADTLREVFERFPSERKPNETQTEDDLIWPVLTALGWSDSLRQQNLTVKGRDDVPDGLLFADADKKAKANQEAHEWKRYAFGLAVVESKRWNRPLDRTSGQKGEDLAPSTQMLRYLRRADDLTSGKLRWGILTNGARWRLYYQGARSVAEQFFEVDLAALLGIGARDDDLFALTDAEKAHALRVFLLMFRREAFAQTDAAGRSFHTRALEEGKFYEERVASDLSNLVFQRVYPMIARAIADAAPGAPLDEVRDASLILLYRLLFILYAEDRDLLPTGDKRYDDYGLRERVRMDVQRRKDENDTFSDAQARYWLAFDSLCRAIDKGDRSIGLPPYNGGLFNEERTELLTKVRLSDEVMADVIDALSFERTDEERRFINYRDLSVQQLGSIYERLLEHEVVREGEMVDIRPNIFARKGSGSYYTPDDLVALILRETLEPLIGRRRDAFEAKATALAESDLNPSRRLAQLKKVDTAERILDLRVCDPAMGSGHFLVSLVDTLADQIILAMAEAETTVEWTEEPYVSPLAQRIEDIRETILANAEEREWTVDAEQLDDRHIIRRMVLKRCVYGVDKNPMAVELAKVSLWLHSFTVGAPLSFLDHHLTCGDSLFGDWVNVGAQKATAYGSPLLLSGPIKEAVSAGEAMHLIEQLPDAEIAEAHRSATIYEGVRSKIAQLRHLLTYVHALDWLGKLTKEETAGVQAWLKGEFGDPFKIAGGELDPAVPEARPEPSEIEKAKRAKSKKTTFDRHVIGKAFAQVHVRARTLIEEEGFLSWQVAFPGVWEDWTAEELVGGFDAVIGNPPWDRMKMQEVEWFAARRREVAMHGRAADRKKAIKALRTDGDPLADDYERARERAEAAAKVARGSGTYPLLSGGDVNLYSLFVERAFAMAKPDGMVGLLVPSGIASDKTAAPFFKSVATEGRLGAFYDFENRRTRYGLEPFFPAVDSRFKFAAIIGSPEPIEAPANLAFFLQSTAELDDPERRFPLAADDFARVNPNTGTAPIFRSRRDAALTTAIYERLPVLARHGQNGVERAWPLRYSTMFHMTNDSTLFRTKMELEEDEGAFPTGLNRYDSASGEWVPLYEGKMVQAFDHRAANIVVNPKNQHRPAQPEPATEEQHADPSWLPNPQFWVRAGEVPGASQEYQIAFKDVTAATNMRTMIAAIVPRAGFGNTLPALLSADDAMPIAAPNAALIVANLNALVYDFIARQKVQGQHLNWYIVEQLPVVPLATFEATKFGLKTAAEIVREAVLELTYTAHDLAPFARDMGHVDERTGDVLPPFAWDEERRLVLRAKLDAVFFTLYGVTDRADVRHVYGAFPIVERQETEAYGSYRWREVCLQYLNALAAGKPDAEVA